MESTGQKKEPMMTNPKIDQLYMLLKMELLVEKIVNCSD